MNERLIVRNFGPITDIDIKFKKVTIFIGDQGTGKSCMEKLFSMFVWLEKQLVLHRKPIDFYQKYDRFKTKLCTYHPIVSYITEATYIKFEGQRFEFEYEKGNFNVNVKKEDIFGVPQIIFIPAERSIVRVAENGSRLLKELPECCETFLDEIMKAKRYFKKGYDLPFGKLRFDYDPLNDISWISGPGYKVRLINALSGVQSALPLCMVTDYLSKMVDDNEEIKLSKEERDRLEKRVTDIMQDNDLSESIKDILLKQLSADTKYNSFINIVEEPELNLFPKSQLEVISTLVRCCNSSQKIMLIITNHSPYTLAILNLMIMAGKISISVEQIAMRDSEKFIDPRCHLLKDDICACRLSEVEGDYCKSIISNVTGLISENDLDSASDDLMRAFNNLYKIYVESLK